MRSLCLAFFLSGSLFGCANVQEYEGPVATVVGTARVVDATTLQSFSIVEISSENVLPHKCGAFAAGQAVPARCIGRDIPAVPKGELQIGANYYAELEPYVGPTGGQTTLSDTVFSTVPGAPVFVGKAPTYRSKNEALGIDLDIKNHNALQSTFVFDA